MCVGIYTKVRRLFQTRMRRMHAKSCNLAAESGDGPTTRGNPTRLADPGAGLISKAFSASRRVSRSWDCHGMPPCRSIASRPAPRLDNKYAREPELPKRACVSNIPVAPIAWLQLGLPREPFLPCRRIWMGREWRRQRWRAYLAWKSGET